MKVKSVLFFIYFLIMILLLVALLVFRPADKDTESSKDQITTENNTQITDKPTGENNDVTGNTDGDGGHNDKNEVNNGSTDISGDNNGGTDISGDNNGSDEEDKSNTNEEKTFATDLIINLVGDINTFVGVPTKLTDDIVSVEPAEMKSLLTYKITSRYNSDITKISFDGETFIASEAGQYNLIYSVPKTEDKVLEGKIVIKVDDEDHTITQKVSSMVVGDTLNIYECFEINDPENIVKCETSSHFEMTKESITARNVGKGTVVISIIDQFVTRKYEYCIQIKDMPKYIMEISGANGEIFDPNLEIVEINTVVGMYALGCVIYDVKGNIVAQDIVVDVSDTNIVEYIPMGDAILLFNCKSRGETIIKINFNLDTTVYKTILLHIN